MNWVRSSRCYQAECVEVAIVGAGECAGGAAPTVVVRNSRFPDEVAIFDADEWSVFLAGVRSGEFDVDTVANVS